MTRITRLQYDLYVSNKHWVLTVLNEKKNNSFGFLAAICPDLWTRSCQMVWGGERRKIGSVSRLKFWSPCSLPKLEVLFEFDQLLVKFEILNVYNRGSAHDHGTDGDIYFPWPFPLNINNNKYVYILNYLYIYKNNNNRRKTFNKNQRHPFTPWKKKKSRSTVSGVDQLFPVRYVGNGVGRQCCKFRDAIKLLLFSVVATQKQSNPPPEAESTRSREGTRAGHHIGHLPILTNYCARRTGCVANVTRSRCAAAKFSREKSPAALSVPCGMSTMHVDAPAWTFDRQGRGWQHCGLPERRWPGIRSRCTISCTAAVRVRRTHRHFVFLTNTIVLIKKRLG